MIRTSRSIKASLLTLTLSFAVSCAGTDDEQLDEPIQEEMQEEALEDMVVEEPELGSSELSSSEALEEVGETLEAAEVVEPEGYEESLENIESSSEALSSELDKLTNNEETATEGEMDTELASDSAAMYSDTLPQAAEDEVESLSPPEEARASESLYSTSNGEYVVQPGDTLAKIAKKLYGSQSQWRRLADTNSISNPNKIFPGDVLKYEDNDETRNYQQALASIGAETTVVQAGETLASIAERVLGKSDYWKPIWRQNIDIIPNPNMIFAGQTLSYIDPNKVNQALGHKHDQMTH